MFDSERLFDSVGSGDEALAGEVDVDDEVDLASQGVKCSKLIQLAVFILGFIGIINIFQKLKPLWKWWSRMAAGPRPSIQATGKLRSWISRFV